MKGRHCQISSDCRPPSRNKVRTAIAFQTMQKSQFLVLFTIFSSVHALPATVQAANPCPTDTEYACFDVINSSLCLSQNASRNGTAAQMAACVDYPGGMSSLSGASKVGALDAKRRWELTFIQLCRCPGCHAAYINEAISKLFPPPCS